MSKSIHPYLNYPHPCWANQSITIQEVLRDLMQPLDSEKQWSGDVTADCLFRYRFWVASHYWKNYLNESVLVEKLPRYFSAQLKAEVKLWNVLFKVSEQMQAYGLISSAPSSFGSLIVERKLTL